MKIIIICFLLLFTFSLSSQQKGATPINEQPTTTNQQQTYAVVVGISDYQDEGIPDLRFADKDAEAFANFLQSPAGGSLDEDHLKVLTNESATSGQFASALYWLMDECQEGDQAIIYFSGHGDVESSTFSQPGYLLCWDSPSRVYMAGGTLAIPMFQLVVSTLSLEKKAKVVVITDACRAGKLAGSEVNGSKLTSSNLSEQFANELKILSCQPDEYSIEGEQWGGGRGAFSYHLVDGLYGLADGNADLSVSLMEVGRYLQDKVSAEVAPHNQLPMTVGNPREILANVNDNLLEKVKQRREGEMPLFTSTVTKGIEEEVLSLVDSITKMQYIAFKKALTDKMYFEPKDASAEFYYNLLIQKPLLAKIHASMRRNYAAALQDDAQQAINRFLTSDPATCIATSTKRLTDYGTYPASLKRAIELLGENHYMYSKLQARRLWFEGLLLDEEYKLDKKKKENPELAVARYKEALTYQPDMALAMVELGFIYGLHLSELDSAEHYFEKAIALCPNWMYLLLNYGNYFQYDKGDMEEAKIRYDKMAEIDSTSANTYSALADYYYSVGNDSLALYYYEKLYSIVPLPCNRSTLVKLNLKSGKEENLKKAEGLLELSIEEDPHTTLRSYLGMIYLRQGRLKEAKEAILKTREYCRPTWNGTYVNLCLYYLAQGEEEKAKEQFKMGIGRDPDYSTARWLQWWFRVWWPTYGDGDFYFKKMLEWFPDYTHGHYEYAKFLSANGQYETAFHHLELALRLGFKDFGLFNYQDEDQQDKTDLAPLRTNKDRWNTLMNQYNVPEEYRNQ